MNICNSFKANQAELDLYLRDAQDIARLSIPSIEPIPAGDAAHQYSTKQTSLAMQRPYSDVGARGVKGMAATITSILNPSNVQNFKLQINPSLSLSEEARSSIDSYYLKSEKRIKEFLASKSFQSFAYALTERVLVEGNVGVKVDKEKGFLLYPLRCVNTERSFGSIKSITFKEVLQEPDKENDGKMKTVCQYIYVDKVNNTVSVQREDEDKPKLKKDEKASQYFVVTTSHPTTTNYARSYFSDHIGLLNVIDNDSRCLIEATTNAAWNWIGYTGSRPIAEFANIKSRQIVKVQSHDDLRPFSFNVKLGEWAFVANRLDANEQKFLSLSAVGLQSRASSIQTATEVRALLAELEALVGSVAQCLAETFYQQVIQAVIDVLDLPNEIRKLIMEEAGLIVDDATIHSLMSPVITTGSPAMAREIDTERFISLTKEATSIFGPQAVASYINIPVALKNMYDGLRINTDGIVNEKPAIDPNAMLANTTAAEAQAMGPARMQQLLQQQPNANAAGGDFNQ